MVNPPVTIDNTTSTTIGYNVWVAGGEDFVVARPRTTGFYPDATQTLWVETDYTAQMDKSDQSDMQSVFKKTFDALSPAMIQVQSKVVMGEVTNRWTEYYSRYKILRQFSTSGGNTFLSWDLLVDPIDIGASLMDPTLFDFFRMFKYYRGGFRIKVLPYGDINFQTMHVTNFNDEAGAFVSAGMSWVYGQSVKPVNEAEIAYYSRKYFHVYGTSDVENWGACIYIGASGASAARILFAVGQDFNMGWPLPPPVLYEINPDLVKTSVKSIPEVPKVQTTIAEPVSDRRRKP
jgi:hypothetical protein